MSSNDLQNSKIYLYVLQTLQRQNGEQYGSTSITKLKVSSTL